MSNTTFRRWLLPVAVTAASPMAVRGATVSSSTDFDLSWYLTVMLGPSYSLPLWRPGRVP